MAGGVPLPPGIEDHLLNHLKESGAVPDALVYHGYSPPLFGPPQHSIQRLRCSLREVLSRLRIDHRFRLLWGYSVGGGDVVVTP